MSGADTMTYRGYAARVAFDAADGIFVGHLAGIDDLIGFHAGDVSSLETAFHEAVDDYVAACEAIGKTPQRPYSGTLTIRVTPEVHARAALAARLSGKSLDRWGEEVLSSAADAATAD